MNIKFIKEIAFPIIYLLYGVANVLEYNDTDVVLILIGILITALNILLEKKSLGLICIICCSFLSYCNIPILKTHLVFFIPLIIYLTFMYLDFNLKIICGIIAIIGIISLKDISPIFVNIIISFIALLNIEIINYSENIFERYSDYYFKTSKEVNDINNKLLMAMKEQNSKVEAAIFDERNRIARDMHDSIGHLTSRGILQIGAMLVTEKDGEKRKSLMLLKDTLSEGMGEVRANLHHLRNSGFDLENEVYKIANENKSFRVNYKYSIQGELSLNYKTTILMIIKEAVNNIYKHCNGNEFTLNLIEINNMIFININDNGTNINQCGNGIGLLSIIERVKSLNGEIDIYTENGFRIFIKIPIGDNNENTNS